MLRMSAAAKGPWMLSAGRQHWSAAMMTCATTGAYMTWRTPETQQVSKTG